MAKKAKTKKDIIRLALKEFYNAELENPTLRDSDFDLLVEVMNEYRA